MRRLLPLTVKPSKISRVPVYLIHFVTSRCNARCPHCFIFTPDDPRFAGSQLTAEEIDRFTRSLGRTIFNVSLTGGEPFLRRDLEAIMTSYLSNSGTQVMSVFTNGFFPGRTVEAFDRFSRDWPDRNFVLTTSVDDLHDAHDGYRGLRSGFEKALSTYEGVRALGRPNIDLSISLTVSHANEDHLDAIYDYLVHERGLKTLACTLVRGDPLDPESKEVDLDNYRRFSERIDAGLRSGELDCFSGFAGSGLINAKSVVMREQIQRTLETGYQSPCYAGRLIGVMYANGDVYPCELLDRKIGNIRDTDCSLPELWASNEAGTIRDEIWDTHCHCTHECFMTVNVLFNPRFYPRLLSEYSKVLLKIGTRGRNRAE